MAEDDPEVYYWVRDDVAYIQLHRPESLNAWTPRTGRQLLNAVRTASSDPGIRCAVVTGAGSAFCAGADVKNPPVWRPDGTPDVASRLRLIYNPVVTEIRSAPIPFIAAVHGACAGLGVSLALACDVVVAAQNAFFLLAFVRLGLAPDCGVTYFLRERVGAIRVTELSMLGERLGADRALAWGLVHSVHPPTEYARAADDLAKRLAGRDPGVISRAKTALVHHRLAALRRQAELEADLQQRHGPTRDYAEGIAAFTEKRTPVFTGS